MRFSKAFIERVLQASDIVQVISSAGIALKAQGGIYKALCPFHSEKTPSFNVNPQRQFYYCFGCHASGDAAKFLVEHEKLSFGEAIQDLAHQAGIPLETTNAPQKTSNEADPYFECMSTAAHFFQTYLQQNAAAEAGRAYLNQRHFSQALLDAFMVGMAPNEWQALLEKLQSASYSPQILEQTQLIRTSDKGRRYDFFRNRIMFPIRDLRGRCIAFGGRTLDADQPPKYLNSSDNRYYHKSQVLYGFYEGLSEIKKRRNVIVVEGYFDVIRMHESGFEQAVAPCGTALTKEHLKLIQRYADSVTLLFDGDVAGQNAALKSCQMCLPVQLDVHIVSLPAGDDPDTFLRTHGKEAFEQVLKNQQPLLDFWLTQTLLQHPDTPQGRLSAIRALLPDVNAIPQEEWRQLILVKISEIMSLPSKTLFQMAEALISQKKHANVQNFEKVDQPVLRPGPERALLRALFSEPQLISVSRNYVSPQEFQNTTYQQIYTQILNQDPNTMKSSLAEHLQQQFPDLSHAIMEIYMELGPLDHMTQQLQKAIVQVKEASLQQQLQQVAHLPDSDAQLQASVTIRKQRQELSRLFQQEPQTQSSH